MQDQKKEWVWYGICFGFFLIVSFFLSNRLLALYQENYIENNARILESLIQSHPEFEYEIIDLLKKPKETYDPKILAKYGFSKSESFLFLGSTLAFKHHIFQIVFGSFTLCFLFFLSFVFYFYRRKKRRLEEINSYMFRVLNNDYPVDMKDYQEDAISVLKNDLLKVTNKLRIMSESSLQDKKNLERTLSDISHQLRTPLTSLYVINDALKSPKISKAERDVFLHQQKEQLERMEWLIVTLLKVSQIDSGTIQFQRENVAIHKIVEEALKPLLIPLELKNISCVVDIPTKLKHSLDEHWTVEALLNIIKNAVEHTPKEGHITISANDNPLYLEIMITDDGCGIKKEMIPHLFERFYKVNPNSDSIGIGLNLTKTIVEKQDGTIHVESEIGKGTTFIIHFYKTTI